MLAWAAWHPNSLGKSEKKVNKTFGTSGRPTRYKPYLVLVLVVLVKLLLMLMPLVVEVLLRRRRAVLLSMLHLHPLLVHHGSLSLQLLHALLLRQEVKRWDYQKGSVVIYLITDKNYYSYLWTHWND